MRTPDHLPLRCVGAIAHDSRGRLLVIQRGHDPGRGLWSLPGGRVEPGETDAQALVREMREETGLEVRPIRLAGTVVRGRYEIHDYICEVTEGDLRPGDDAADARWVDAAALDALALTAGLAETLRDWDSLPRR